MLWKLIRSYTSTRKGELVLLLLLQVAATFAALEMPSLNARIIDEGVTTANIDTIWRLGTWMILLTIVQSLATATAVFLGSRIAMGLGAWLRHRVFHRTQTFAAVDMQHFGVSSLVTRTTNDVQQIQMVVLMGLAMMTQAPIMGIGGLIQAVRQNPTLSLLFVVMVPALVIIVTIFMRLLSPQFARQQKRIDQMNTVVREALTGVRVVRAFVRQDFMADRYRQANDELTRVALRIGALFAVMFPLVGFVISASNVAVIWFGGHLIDAGNMQVGSLFAFINYVGMIFVAVMMASMMFMMVPRAAIAATRVGEVLEYEVSIHSPQTPVELPHENEASGHSPWTFALDDVSLQYLGAESPVLSHVSLTLQPGTTTAVIGSTGAGKTTLVNLFPRLMDPTCGSVTANGVPLSDISLTDLRRHIAVVPQRTHLFAGTVASNVCGQSSPDAEQRERITRALRGARALDFVSALDEGMDSPVESGGTNFSGGQRQRLAIARALYRDADLYIFDDSFSALDTATDAALRRHLPEHTGKGAVLIVAQRVASIREADTIIVLDGGDIVGQGTHEELLASCQIYQEIVASQNSREEAA